MDGWVRSDRRVSTLCIPRVLQISVAVKTLHAASDDVNRALFLQEAALMMNLNHPYIVKLLGVCHGPPLAMVT